MALPPKHEVDSFIRGDWNTICFECGNKFKASMMRRHWQGYWVCPQHWEPRHEQDFVKNVADNQVPPWMQPPPADVFTHISAVTPTPTPSPTPTPPPSPGLCTPDGQSAIPKYAVPGCCIPGFISPFFTP